MAKMEILAARAVAIVALLATEPVTAQTAGDVEVFAPAAFAAFNPNNALDMVNRIPGFDFNGGDAVRGLTGSAGNVLIDRRRPASKAEALGDILSRIPAADVERIELIRNGAGGVDMQGYAVVANVVRRGAATVQQQSSVAIVLFPDDPTTWNLGYDVTRRQGDRTLELSAFANNTLSSQGNADGRRIRTGSAPYDADLVGEAVRTNVNLRGAWALPWHGGDLRLRASAAWTNPWTREEIRYSPAVVDAFESEAPRLTTEVGADFSRRLSGDRQASLVLVARRDAADTWSLSRTASGEARFETRSDYVETAARLSLSQKRSDALTFEYGGEIALNRLDSETAFLLNGAPQSAPNADVVVEELRGEAFGGLRWTHGAWGVESALHVEASRLDEQGDVDLSTSFVFLKPRTVLSWAPTPDDRFTLTVERRVGQLDFNDFAASASFTTGTIDAGNADLEPDKRWLAEAVWRRRFWGEGSLVLTARHEEIQDVLDRVPVGAFDALGNIGDGRRDTARIDLTLPLGRFGIEGAQAKVEGVWIRSRVEDPITGRERPISGDIPRQISLAYTQDLPRLNARWGFDLSAASESTAYRVFEERRTETGTSLGLLYEQRLPRDFVLYAYVANLLEDRFVRDRLVYQGQREISPVAYREFRDARYPLWAYIRLRRRF